jgi:phosphopantetheinyl transferase
MPLVSRHTQPLWGLWKIEESPEELLAQLSQPGDYLPALAGMRTERRKQEWLAVRVLLKALTGEEPQIAYRPNGAPYLPGKPLHISISHTKGYAALILNEERPTGIDIEYHNERILKVRSRFMNPEEEAMIDPAHEVEHLLLCWCAKETLFKLIGENDIDFCKHLHITPFPYSETGSLIATETRTPQAASYVLRYLSNKYLAIGWFLETVETN